MVGILAGGLVFAVLPTDAGSSADFPAVPDAATRTSLEMAASFIASADGVAKEFPLHGEVVLTTQEKALDLEDDGGAAVGNTSQPVYMVQVTGEFVPNNVPGPSGWNPTPAGAFFFLRSPVTGQSTDFGITTPKDLSTLGEVSEIDLTPPPSRAAS